MVKVLLAFSSYYGSFYDDGAKTGVFFDEAYHPWKALVDAGADVTLVSETGTFGWDEHSLVGDFADASVIANDESHPFIKATKEIRKASDVDASEYDIFFAAGGHGAIFDFPEAKDLHKHILAIAKKDGVVAAVCHGPAIFENIKTEDGEYFIKGKNLTGFTDEGEKLLKVDHIMKVRNLKTPKEGSIHAGANYIEPADPWASFTVTDGKLVTGVNPASATETAEKALAAYNQSAI